MGTRIMTQVTATLPEERATEVVAAFERLLAGGRPDGLLRTELLRGTGGEWRIETLWRDRAALDAMRAGPEPPAAPTLFRGLGAEPVLHVYVVEAASG